MPEVGLAEFIYIATSPQYPGMVKIGRTDRTVEERMQELSAEGYGLEDAGGKIEWEASSVLVVEDNVTAEAKLHDHFADSRVSEDRELFLLADPDAVAAEASAAVDGRFITDLADSDIAVEALEKLVELGLVFGVGAILGRALHKKLSGSPRYDAALRDAARYSSKTKTEVSRALGHLEARWDAAEPWRADAVSVAQSAGMEALHRGKEALGTTKSALLSRIDRLKRR